MSNDLIPTQDEVKAIEVMTKHAVDSKYVEKLGGFAGVFSIAMYARELGIPVMTALFGGMANIMGKITISPQLMNSMIRKAGHKLEIDSNEQRCIIKGFRKDTGESCTVSFSVDEAKRAGIYKEGGGWAKYPSDMCFARSLSRLARRLYPDVIGNSYVEGEIEDDDKEKPKQKSPVPQRQPELQQAEAQVIEKTDDELIKECIEMFGQNEHPDFPIEAYLKFCSEKFKKPTVDFAKGALENNAGFAQAYKKWADKKEDELLSQIKKPETITTV